jgi:TetR/AcrR family transcriptional regulator, cholesterol catabolism regulator
MARATTGRGQPRASRDGGAAASSADGAGRQGAKRAAPRGNDRRGEILEIATRIFAEKGFVNATVRDIADEAGILSGSLYHHFDSKESMAEELLRTYLERMVAAYEAAVGSGEEPGEVLRIMISCAYDSVIEHRHEVTVLHNDWAYLRQFPQFRELDELGDRVEAAWVKAVRRGQRSGAFRKKLDPHLVYRTIMGSILATVRWFDPGGKIPMSEIARQQTHIFLSGVLAQD